MKRYGKKVITSYQRYIDGENFEVLVLDGGDCFNIHVISERYRDDELNTLKLQEHKDDMRNVEGVHTIEDAKNYYNKARLIGFLMEHFIWDRFYDEGMFTGYVNCSFEEAA